ncbi:MAG: hypothetical protein HC843_07300 [Sphingomonadales bacterium]|nr:hypothetical protein [Sphingomonadales bacterium]
MTSYPQAGQIAVENFGDTGWPIGQMQKTAPSAKHGDRYFFQRARERRRERLAGQNCFGALPRPMTYKWGFLHFCASAKKISIVANYATMSLVVIFPLFFNIKTPQHRCCSVFFTLEKNISGH